MDEEKNIAKVISGIPLEIKHDAEIIVVDASTDCTAEIARKLGAKVIGLPKIGKGYQMHAGVEAAKGEILIFMDGDGEHPPRYIPQLLAKLDECDIVLGARSLSMCQNFANLLYFTIAWRLYKILTRDAFRRAGLQINGDPFTGFRVLRRKTWYGLALQSVDFLLETEMNMKAAKLGLRIGEVPIPVAVRKEGLFKSRLFANPRQYLKIMNYLNSEV